MDNLSIDKPKDPSFHKETEAFESEQVEQEPVKLSMHMDSSDNSSLNKSNKSRVNIQNKDSATQLL